MHVINLLAGLCFYIITPITLSYCDAQNTFKVPLLIFSVVLNFIQFRTHVILSKLKKYSIPNNILFAKITSPHYTAEVLLYALYFLSAPHILTLMMFFFVCLNLVHQSKMTYDWYVDKFGKEFESLGRYKILPFLY